MNFKIILALLACFLAHPVSAEFIRDGELYLGAAGYLFDSDRNLEEGLSFEAGFERPLSSDLSWDLWFSMYNADGKRGGPDSRTKRLSPGVLYHLNEGNTRAFLSAGMGHQKFDLKSSSKVKETAIHL
ncbi:hypothetical protein, partial [Oleiphilus sp. HI0128]